MSKAATLDAVSKVSDALAGDSKSGAELQKNLLKLRVVLLLLSAPWGTRGNTVATLVSALRSARVKASARSIYNWRRRYIHGGFAGIVRQRRSDYGSGRRVSQALICTMVNLAARVRNRGDIATAYRRLKPPVTFKAFWKWIHRLQAQFRVIEMPQTGDRIDIVF